MRKTSTDAKRRYNEKAYDRIALTVPKGKKEVYRERAAEQGMSLNSYINKLLEDDLNPNNEESPV